MTIEKTRTTQPTNRQQTATIKARRAALAGGVGTLIEYYDFSLYGYMAVIIAPLFFPSDRPLPRCFPHLQYSAPPTSSDRLAASCSGT